MNSFPFSKDNLLSCVPNKNRLITQGGKMHFNSLFIHIIKGLVFKLRKFEISRKFSIYSCQYIQVKLGSNASCIVVCFLQVCFFFLEIKAYQHCVSMVHLTSQFCKKYPNLEWFEISYARSEERR